jgi:hypothetical protein
MGWLGIWRYYYFLRLVGRPEEWLRPAPPSKEVLSIDESMLAALRYLAALLLFFLSLKVLNFLIFYY